MTIYGQNNFTIIGNYKMNKKIDLSDISFLSELEEHEHPRYKNVYNNIHFGNISFSNYLETFERLVAERCIMTGNLVSVEDISPLETDDEHCNFARLVGVSQYGIYRVQISQDFLELLQRDGLRKVLRKEKYKDTLYYKDLMKRLTESSPTARRDKTAARARSRVEKFATLFVNMASQDGLVGDALSDSPSSSLSYYDLPWAVDYDGYIKRLDGAHRRAIAAYLGHTTIPTLVFRVNEADDELLEGSCEYLQQHFPWFKRTLSALRKL